MWQGLSIPFDGPVSEDVVVVDEGGNAIKVPQGNWLTGSKDGKWIQEMQPGVGPKGVPTGQRKDLTLTVDFSSC